jgi:hypothetical protein
VSISGSINATACGTGITRASKGTAKPPTPPPNPAFETPEMRTAVTAAIQNQGSVKLIENKGECSKRPAVAGFCQIA